jgi:signal transduction histidine kinase
MIRGVHLLRDRRRLDALAEVDRAKTQFFANISHEFRTPLTLMLGPLDEMKRESAGAAAPSPHHPQFDLVHRNGLRLLKLVNTLLDFSRIEAGRVQALYEATDRTRPVRAAALVVDSVTDDVIGSDYAATFCWRSRFQFHGSRSSMRLAG